MKYLNSLVLVAIALVSGCATASKISSVQIGMTKDQVIQVMGKPTSSSAQGQGWEYMNFALSETPDDAFIGRTTPYYVRLVNGRVESFGRLGDFNSTQRPTVRVETDSTVKADLKTTDQKDLSTELQKLKKLKDEGVLTEDEFSKAKQKLLSEK